MNAAEAALIAGAFMATQVQAVVIIVSTVSGSTAIKLSNLIPHIVIVAVTRNRNVARKLQLYKGVLAVVYNSKKNGFFSFNLTKNKHVTLVFDYGW